MDFLKGSSRRLEALRAGRYLIVQGGRQSLGTPGPLRRDELFRLSDTIRHTAPLWVSEPVGFSRSPTGSDLDFPIPVCPDRPSLRILANHAREVRCACEKPLLLENIASHIRPAGPMRETEFLNELSEKAGCELAIDLAALAANGRNHGFRPRAWLREIEPHRVAQLRLRDCRCRAGRWFAEAGDRIPPEIWTLLEAALANMRPKAVILGYSGLPSQRTLEPDLQEARRMLGVIARSSEQNQS